MTKPKRKMITEHVCDLNASDLIGSVGEVAVKLKEKIDLQRRFDLNNFRIGMAGGFDSEWLEITGERHETDAEYDKRVARSKRDKERRKRLKVAQAEQKEVRDKKEYEKLKARFG